ncbi:hypothetical protein KR067_013590 [Drosophila pandora]|nr:hypothetical protein KR067_013590 [Drosophila pandora]
MAFVPQSSAASWEKFLSCSRQGAQAAASLIRESIPALRSLLICIDYAPPTSPRRSYLRSLKISYEMLRRGAFDKPNCIIDPLRGAANILKPYVKQIEILKCLDE